MNPTINQTCYVYFIHAESTNRVKIGYSENPTKRVCELQTGSPYFLKLVKTWHGSTGLERAIHESFSGRRKIGEWFEIEESEFPEAFEIINNLTGRFAIVSVVAKTTKRPKTEDEPADVEIFQELRPIRAAFKSFQPSNEAQMMKKKAAIHECNQYSLQLLKGTRGTLLHRCTINSIADGLHLDCPRLATPELSKQAT